MPATASGSLVQRLWPLWLLLVVLVGAAMRLWQISTVPPGLFFDVAANLFDVVDVLNGERRIWFPRNNGREPLMIYLQAALALQLGVTALAAKVAAAALGIATIPALYVLAREVAESLGLSAARRVGLIAAFLCATLYWHVNFSRLGLRTIALPLFLALGIALLLRGLRGNSATIAVIGGVATGLAAYTYLASRLAPLFIVPAIVAIGLRRRDRLHVVAAYVAAAAVTVAPFAYHFVRHPADIFSRTGDVSVLNPAIGQGDPLGASLRGLALSAAAIVWRGTGSGMENLPGRPLLEPATAAMFALGTAYVIARRRGAGLLLLLWLAVMLLPAALAVDPPNFSRISGAIAAVVVLAALGYDRLIEWTRPIAALLLAVPLVATTYDYFVVWAPSETAYRWMMEDKVQGAERIQGWLASGERVFLAPLLAGDYTYQLLLRDTAVESFDLGQSLVEPADGRARYAFPPDDRLGISTIAARLGRGTFDSAADASGRFPLLHTIFVDSHPPPRAPPLAVLGGDIELVTAEPSSASLRGGETYRLHTTWHARGRPPLPYTIFVHGRDASNTTRFQADRVPGAGSVPTTRWQPGDTVHDYVDIQLPRLVPGEYRAVVGLYHAPTGERLVAIDRPERPNEVLATRLTILP